MLEPDCKARVVAQVEDRDVEQVAEVDVAGELVAPVSRERTAVDVPRVGCDHAHGVAVHADEAHDLVGAPQRTDLEERPLVGDQLDRPPNVECGRPLAGNDREQLFLGSVGGIVGVGREDARCVVHRRGQVGDETSGLGHRLLLALGEVVDGPIGAVDPPITEVLLRDVVSHGVAHDRRTGDEQLADVAHHHREVSEDRLRRADSDDRTEQHVDDGDGRELLRVFG